MTAKPKRQDDRGGDAALPRVGRRRAAWIVVVAVLALGVTMAVAWWQERPLADAEAALASGNVKRATQLVGEFLDRRPENSRALALKARILVQMGRPSEAIGIFDRIGAASPDDEHALARALLMQQEWSTALPLLEHVVSQQPANADAWYELTSCRTRLGLFREALDSAARFAAVPGNEARGQVFLASIHNDLRNHRPAAEAFATALEHDPTARTLQVTPDDFFAEYGRTLLELGQLPEALEMLDRSLREKPTAEAWSLKGQTLAQSSRQAEADEAWRQALNVECHPRRSARKPGLVDAAERQSPTSTGMAGTPGIRPAIARQHGVLVSARLYVAGESGTGRSLAATSRNSAPTGTLRAGHRCGAGRRAAIVLGARDPSLPVCTARKLEASRTVGRRLAAGGARRTVPERSGRGPGKPRTATNSRSTADPPQVTAHK
jgi:Flp pilus assembly protein TadD